jgi:hypothetical protein
VIVGTKEEEEAEMEVLKLYYLELEGEWTKAEVEEKQVDL